MVEVDFYFDFACPRSYLATLRLTEACLRTGSRINWKAIDSNDLCSVEALEGSKDPETAAWQAADLAAWAAYCNVPVQLPPDWPRSYPAALRVAAAAAAAGEARKFVPAAYAAIYGRGDDLENADVLRRVAESAGLEADPLLARSREAGTAATLAGNARELESRGGFRSATMFVGEQMFCGNSRMPLVEFALGQASDRQFVMPGQHG